MRLASDGVDGISEVGFLALGVLQVVETLRVVGATGGLRNMFFLIFFFWDENSTS